MTPLFQSKPAPKQKKKVTTDGLEMLKPKAIGQAVVEQIAQPIDFGEWLGFKKTESGGKKKSTEMKPGVSYNPKDKQEPKPEASAEAPMNYHREILHAGENELKKETQESAQKIQMLISELQRLATSVKQIEKTLILQAVDPSAGKKTGKYYESFFEWMLMVVQDARRKVEDSGAWLSAMGGKKGKQNIHKTMKSNMQVGMSGERTQANNAG